jgi:glucose-1-phosphate thymidylyltransferase
VTPRALILARGLGTRMRAENAGAALSDEQRRAADAGLKAMMPIAGRPFLDFLLSALADAGVTSVGLVVAPDHAALRRHYEAHPPARVSLTFLVQPEPRGTADAVLAAEQWAGGDAQLVVNGDNLYSVASLRALAALPGPGVAAFSADDLVATSNIEAARVSAFALIERDDDGYLRRIVEKPSPDDVAGAGPHVRVSMNCWRFDHRIFDACRGVPLSPRGELELPAAVMLATARGVRFRVVEADGPVLDLSQRADAAELTRRLAGVPPRP